MTEAVIAFLLAMAVKHYLGLGSWVWWLLGIAFAFDLFVAWGSAITEAHK